MKSYAIATALGCMMAPLVLAGCGGGSGGPNGAGGTAEFSSFSQLKPNTATTIKGNSRQASYTVDAHDNIVVSAFAAASPISANLKVDSEGDPTSVELTTSSGKKTWDQDNSDWTMLPGVGQLMIAANKNDENTIAVADPQTNHFEYQTYGAWLETAANGGGIGIFSVGDTTPSANVPGSSSATFKGTAGGLYAKSEGAVFMTADAALSMDFAAKEAQFSTSNTRLNSESASQLDMSGTLAYTDSGLSGNLATTDGSMQGTAEGRFYGASAQEVGGTFELSGGGAAMAGGYGGVKQ